MDLEPIQRLTKDLASAARTLSAGEARFLVDAYYSMQENRIRTGAQIRALTESEEPHDVLRWLNEQDEALEGQIKRALSRYAESSPLGEWALSIDGIGPVITAGLMAHIDITKAPTVGHIWRFAGLDPTQAWSKGQKRPWNASLKTLCWKIGQSFMKLQIPLDDRPAPFYARIYRDRKKLEIERNIAGAFSEQAELAIAKRKIGADTDAILWYTGRLSAEAVKVYYETPPEKRMSVAKKLAGESGTGVRMLPPGHIDARARRYAVKLFLSHYHERAYTLHYGKAPPLPYPIAMLGHAHKI